ncbi:MAG: HypC/HybG/HupF family hydrogenase formation chaperone [Clostridia bacterium]|jgi:hydrogenase expression/formation protein HypC|nr:HypC/HybG/HupF family hydrogenase formation chaperone [Clostridia bacterium]MBT7123396.1 HypC/HybG/HupF family hydrogenase formation chaperone [Clostridia bacterium]
MCLAAPARITKIIDKDNAFVDIRGVTQKTNISLVDINVGDWVLIHAGIAINTIDEELAADALKIIDELDVDANEL